MTKDDIIRICKYYKIEDYTINDDMSVDVNGCVDLFSYKLSTIRLKFNKVGGFFNCSLNWLTTLDNCPKYVGGDFYCNFNHITQRQSLYNISSYGIVSSDILWKF